MYMSGAKLTNKERVKTFFLDNKKMKSDKVDADFIATALNIRRNTASAILNELVREGFLYKLKSRPVLFRIANKNIDVIEGKNIDDRQVPFRAIIGYNKSLKKQIDICRIVATYPGRGLPVLLLGPSGVGKSTLAKYIYLYSKYKSTISSNCFLISAKSQSKLSVLTEIAFPPIL